MTRTEIVGNSILMLLAGYDTTANTIISLAYSIAADKDVQEKLYKEILDTEKKYVSKKTILCYKCDCITFSICLRRVVSLMKR